MPDVAEGMTTKALRDDLMKYFESCEDEVVKAKVKSADPNAKHLAKAGLIALKDLAQDQRNAREIATKPDKKKKKKKKNIPKDKEFDI